MNNDDRVILFTVGVFVFIFIGLCIRFRESCYYREEKKKYEIII